MRAFLIISILFLARDLFSQNIGVSENVSSRDLFWRSNILNPSGSVLNRVNGRTVAFSSTYNYTLFTDNRIGFSTGDSLRGANVGVYQSGVNEYHASHLEGSLSRVILKQVQLGLGLSYGSVFRQELKRLNFLGTQLGVVYEMGKVSFSAKYFGLYGGLKETQISGGMIYQEEQLLISLRGLFLVDQLYYQFGLEYAFTPSIAVRLIYSEVNTEISMAVLWVKDRFGLALQYDHHLILGGSPGAELSYAF